MKLFIDKYRPKSFDDLKYSKDSDDKLISLAAGDNTPHLILRGNYGCGKKTRTLLYLREKFGDGVYKMKTHFIEASVPNKKDPIPLQVSVSDYHYQFNPSFHGVYDRVLIQKFVDEIVKYKTLSNIKQRTIVIEDSDLLTFEAQQSLCRTLETRIKNCRFIFLVNNVGHLIKAINSRCIPVDISSPTVDEIKSILIEIAKGEKLAINSKLLDNIAINSERNVTQAINTLQKICIKDKDQLVHAKLALPDDVAVAEQVIDMLVKGKGLDIFPDIRKKINELSIHNISPARILYMLFMRGLMRIPKSNIDKVHEVCKLASYYDNTIRMGGKFIYHIEAFCLHYFEIIKILQVTNAVPRAAKPAVIKTKPKVIAKTKPVLKAKTKTLIRKS